MNENELIKELEKLQDEFLICEQKARIDMQVFDRKLSDLKLKIITETDKRLEKSLCK